MLEKGIGAGFGAAYVPWTTTENLDTHSHSRKFFCKLTGRNRHCLSEIEEGMFYGASRNWDIDDARENIRLEIPLTEKICKVFGFHHRKCRGEDQLVPFTTDLLITMRSTPQKIAVSGKPRHLLRNPGDCRSLFVEHVYWSLHEVPVLYVTDIQVTKNTLTSLKFLRPESHVAEATLLDDPRCLNFLTAAAHADWTSPLLVAVREISTAISMSSTEGMEIFKRLVWAGHLSCDLERAISSDTRNAVISRISRSRNE